MKKNPNVPPLTSNSNFSYRTASVFEQEVLAAPSETGLSQECLTMLNSLPIGVYRVAPNGEIIHVNTTFATMLGYDTPEEILNRGRVQLFFADLNDWKKQNLVLEETKKVHAYEVEFRTKNGHRLWLRNIARPYYDQNGDFLYIDGTIEDITAQKDSEARILSSENCYRELYDESKNQAKEINLMLTIHKTLFAELNVKKIFRLGVEAISRSFGYRYVSLYLVRGNSLFLECQVGYEKIPVEISFKQGVIGRVARTGRGVAIANPSKDMDYLTFAPDITAELCVPLISDGKVIGVLNVENDSDKPIPKNDLTMCGIVGEYIVVASERARLYQEAKRIENQLYGIMDESADGIFLVDEHGVIIEWNYGQEKVTGLSRDLAVGKKIWEVPELMNIQSGGRYQNFEGDAFSENVLKETLVTDLSRLDEDIETAYTFDLHFETDTKEKKYFQVVYTPTEVATGITVLTCYVRDLSDAYLQHDLPVANADFLFN